MILSKLSSNKISSASSLAFTLYEKSRLGEKKEGKVEYSPLEATYLIESKKMKLMSDKKELSAEEIKKKFSRLDKRFETKYAVFSDLRKKGYIVKTALKFGAEFRVYEKGVKPGEDHALWILECFKENETIKWKEFTSKNRVAHSTNKKLLIAIVDDESDVSYYQSDWVKI